VRETKRNTEGIGGVLSAGVTGENLPHSTNQSEKTSSDRVLLTYFLVATWTNAKNTSDSRPAKSQHFGVLYSPVWDKTALFPETLTAGKGSATSVSARFRSQVQVRRLFHCQGILRLTLPQSKPTPLTWGTFQGLPAKCAC